MNTERSAADQARTPFLRVGEHFYTNYRIGPTTESPNRRSLEEYIEDLTKSDLFASVRTSTEAVFDNKGKPYEGAAAIFVVPKPVTPSPEA